MGEGFDLIAALARVLGISPRLARAVFVVESGGSAGNGRMVVRFEAHIFRDELKDDARFAKHFRLDVPEWKIHEWRPSTDAPWRPYHDDQPAEWQVLEFAMGLNETAALRSTSMGVAQIMGFNHQRIGYATVQEMFADFAAPGPEAEIVGFFSYVAHTPGALFALQQGDLVTFAKLYNGPAQAERYAELIRQRI